MKLFRALVLIASIAPFAHGANREMVELQRDVATLQDQVRQLNDKLVALTTLMQTTLDNTRQSNAAILSMQDRLGDSLKRQQDVLQQSVAPVGVKLDQMSDDFRSVRESVLDMNSRMNKLDAKLTDVKNSIDVIKNPPTPPPAAVQPQGTVPPVVGTPVQPASFSGGSNPRVASGPPPGMSAETAYTNAFRDYQGGNYDLAMQEFNDYVRYYPTTTWAPNAQYYVGDIFYRRKDYDNAIIAFDAVLEHFSDNPKTADSHLMKGKSLAALGKKDAAAREYREVINRYPDTDTAAKAKTMLKDLGLGTPAAKPKRRR